VGAGRQPRVDELEADSVVDAARGLEAGYADAAHLATVRHVRAPVGLQVEADDLDRPDRLDPPVAG